MVIQHNIPAINSHRNLGINNSATAKNLEKLSSGFRINRAGDDAAGLAISEKMRGQIRGLAMAEQNTSNGISLIQTAEGGLNETHAILQRMRELSVQASNGTYQEEDRLQIAREFEAIKDEIDRIAESTHYNGIKLLNGNLSTAVRGTLGTDADSLMQAYYINAAALGLKDGDNVKMENFQYTAEVDAVYGSVKVALGAITAGSVKVGDDFEFDLSSIGGSNAWKVQFTGTAGANLTRDQIVSQILQQFTADYGRTLGMTLSDNGTHLIFTETEGGSGREVTAGTNITMAHNNTVSGGTAITTATSAANVTGVAHVAPKLSAVFNSLGYTSVYDEKEGTFTFDLGNNSRIVIDAEKMLEAFVANGNANPTSEINFNAVQGEKLVFQIGANGGQDQRVYLTVNDMSSYSLGMFAGDTLTDGSTATETILLRDASINTIDDANKAIEIVTLATNMVSAQRADLGALQNRLEHTLNNLGVTKENLTAAESTIRDVDMAKEMMEFTKNNILVQAAQAMLAQANALPQGILQLLR